MENQAIQQNKISLTLSQRLTAYQQVKANNLEEVLSAQSKSLRVIQELYGVEVLQLFISRILADLAIFLNVGKNMNSAQCLQTAELLMRKYPNIHVEDIKLCLTNGKAGEYGKNYDRLDGQVILEWFDKYSIEKLQFIEDRHESTKHSTPDIFGNEQFMEIFKNLTIAKDAEPRKEQTREYSEATILANSWMKDFDNLHREQYKGIHQGTRFVTINGKNLDISEYLNHRLENHQQPQL